MKSGFLFVKVLGLTALLALPLGAPLRAEDAGASEVRATISGQIEAMRQDDGAKAYSFAAPSIHLMFPNADAFMAMVKGGYAPVYHPRQFQFADLAAVDGKLVQNVEITAADGTAWVAQYILARQSDNSLKIEGCKLVQRPGLGA